MSEHRVTVPDVGAFLTSAHTAIYNHWLETHASFAVFTAVLWRCVSAEYRELVRGAQDKVHTSPERHPDGTLLVFKELNRQTGFMKSERYYAIF